MTTPSPQERGIGLTIVTDNPPSSITSWAETYNLDLGHSLLITDDPHLISWGEKEGMLGLYLLTPRGIANLEQLAPNALVFHHLTEAFDWLIHHPEGRDDILRELTRGGEIIRRGGLVAFPTETVYGLGADALNERAVSRIFEAKSRPLYDPLIVHVSAPDEVLPLTTHLPPSFPLLIDRFWPGLTLILPKSPLVPHIVTAGLDSVAIRMPSHPWARRLIACAATPIAAPSANTFGRTSPTCAQHVREQLGQRCDYIIDGGSCRVGVESTVLSLVTSPPTILRPGGISREEIEALIGRLSLYQPSTITTHTEQASPGLYPRHYAPNTPLVITTISNPT